MDDLARKEGMDDISTKNYCSDRCTRLLLICFCCFSCCSGQIQAEKRDGTEQGLSICWEVF